MSSREVHDPTRELHVASQNFGISAYFYISSFLIFSRNPIENRSKIYRTSIENPIEHLSKIHRKWDENRSKLHQKLTHLLTQLSRLS